MPERGFAAAKNFVEGGLKAEKWFRRGGPISQQDLNFAEGTFGCEIIS